MEIGGALCGHKQITAPKELVTNLQITLFVFLFLSLFFLFPEAADVKGSI